MGNDHIGVAGTSSPSNIYYFLVLEAFKHVYCLFEIRDKPLSTSVTWPCYRTPELNPLIELIAWLSAFDNVFALHRPHL